MSKNYKLFNVKFVSYPGSDLVQMIVYRGAFYEEGQRVASNSRDESLDEDVRSALDEKNLRKSQRRAKQAIFDIGYSNQWDYFVTLTTNQALLDRYNYDEVAKKLRYFLHNYRKKAPDMVYMIVPERHKDGAYHFHALLAGVPKCHFVSSVNPHTGRAIYKGGNRVYNWRQYNWGYSTATLIKDSTKAVSYVTKYISKDLLRNTPGRHHYWVSRNVRRPDVYRAMMKSKGSAVYPDAPSNVYGLMLDSGYRLLRHRNSSWYDEKGRFCEVDYCTYKGSGSPTSGVVSARATPELTTANKGSGGGCPAHFDTMTTGLVPVG